MTETLKEQLDRLSAAEIKAQDALDRGHPQSKPARRNARDAAQDRYISALMAAHRTGSLIPRPATTPDVEAVLEKLGRTREGFFRRSDGTVRRFLANPDGPEAAATILDLLAKLETAREALKPFSEAAENMNGDEPQIAAGLSRDAVIAAFAKRIAVYKSKQEAANPYGDDMLNRWEMFVNSIETIEYLADELGILDAILTQGQEG